MRPEQMRRLTIRDVDGAALQLRTDSAGTEAPYYAHQRFAYWKNAMEPVRVVVSKNPLEFHQLYGSLVACGAVEALTLTYAGKTMRLVFGIGEHNTYYEIEGPPFQQGTFRLRSLRCHGGAPPPRIDNRTSGKCLVAADGWERTERGEVGHLVARELAGGFADSTAGSCPSATGRQLEAITTPRDWETAWTSDPGVARGKPLPTVDFTTQFVLVVYRAELAVPLGIESIRVDERGDLTYVHTPGLYAPRHCAMLYVAADRAGVRSVAGQPLPPMTR